MLKKIVNIVMLLMLTIYITGCSNEFAIDNMESEDLTYTLDGGFVPNKTLGLVPTKPTDTAWGGILGYAPPHKNGYCFDMIFSNYKGSIKSLYGQGLTIYCGGCNDTICFVFDGEQRVGHGQYAACNGMTGEKIFVKDINYTTEPINIMYIIGIKGLTDVKDVPEAIYEAITNIRTKESVEELNDQLLVSYQSMELLSRRHETCILRKSDNKYSLYKLEGPNMIICEGVLGTVSGGETPVTQSGEPKDNTSRKGFIVEW